MRVGDHPPKFHRHVGALLPISSVVKWHHLSAIPRFISVPAVFREVRIARRRGTHSNPITAMSIPAPSGSAQPDVNPTNCLIVKNIPDRIGTDTVKSIFEVYGPLYQFSVYPRLSRATVVYVDGAHAVEAKADLHNFLLPTMEPSEPPLKVYYGEVSACLPRNDWHIECADGWRGRPAAAGGAEDVSHLSSRIAAPRLAAGGGGGTGAGCWLPQPRHVTKHASLAFRGLLVAGSVQ